MFSGACFRRKLFPAGWLDRHLRCCLFLFVCACGFFLVGFLLQLVFVCACRFYCASGKHD